MRLFIAWPVPDEVRTEIGRRVEALRPRLPSASWPRTDALHLTLLFLGETPQERFSALIGAVEQTARVPAASVQITGAGFFPSPARPRVAWLGVAPVPHVAAIARAARDAVRATGAGVEEDGRPFHPHLTLARIRGRWRTDDVEAFEEAFSGWVSLPLALDRVVLYQSRLSPKGAEHVPLHEARLRGSVPGR